LPYFAGKHNHKKHNPDNERIKHEYFDFLKEAKRSSEQTVDAAAKSINRFEVYTKYRDFKKFHSKQAIGIKKDLAEQNGAKSGKKLSKSTLHATLTQLKRFFQWLALHPGYKSRLQYSDAEYFNLSEKDMRIATAKREKKSPTLAQIKHILNKMPNKTEIEHRNRALVAFTILTGARDSAIASMKLKHGRLEKPSRAVLVQGTRSAGPQTYQADSRGSEHRATKPIGPRNRFFEAPTPCSPLKVFASRFPERSV